MANVSKLLRILLADDDIELCGLLSEYLGQERFELDAVHYGVAAVKQLTCLVDAGTSLRRNHAVGKQGFSITFLGPVAHSRPRLRRHRLVAPWRAVEDEDL